MTNPTPDTLATTFLALLGEHLTSDQLVEMDRRNACDPEYRKGGCCASHDFVDANMVMAEAMEEFDIELDVNDDTQAALWNAAWEIAFQTMCDRHARGEA